MLVERGANVGTRTEFGVTPLSLAAEVGNAEIIEILIDAGADPNERLSGLRTPLMMAARHGNADSVQLLIDAGSEVNAVERRGQTALMWAAAEGNQQAVEVLLARGADANIRLESGYTALLFAARNGRTEVVELLVSSGVDVNAELQPAKGYERAPRRGMSALMLATESGHFELAIRLVDAGADPNDQRSGLTPLHALCWVRKTKVGDDPEGDPPPRGSGTLSSLEFVTELTRRGADINRPLERGEGGRALLKPRGATPLLIASRTADLPLIRCMVAAGAALNTTNADGCTPLMAAAGIGVTAVGEEPGTEEEVLEVMEYLVAAGADVNASDKNGETAMHGAAYRNFPEVVNWLANHGADPKVWNQKNKYGWTPTMIAHGERPGSLKPSPETIAALEHAIKQ
jgi:ankyrin repeat protein